MVTKTTTIDGAYTVDTYTGSGTTTFTVPVRTTSVTYLVVAGGGSGGAGGSNGGGGSGGAGGMRTGTLAVTPGASLQVVVGAGGATNANTKGIKGENSVFGTITSIGGGYGGWGSAMGTTDYHGGPGGSGGGAGGVAGGTGGAGTTGQGYAGGSFVGSQGGGAGGGGAGGVGGNSSGATGGTAGIGASSSISGSAVTYATGGTGGTVGTIVMNALDLTNLTGTGLSYLVNGSTSNQGATLQSYFNYARDNNKTSVLFPASYSVYSSQKLDFWGTTSSGQRISYYGNGTAINMIPSGIAAGAQFANMWGYCYNMIFDGKITERSSENGIYMMSNTIMDHCTVRNFSAYSLSVYHGAGISNVQMTNNTVYNSYQYGICTGTGDGTSVTNSNITVTGNTVYNCGEVGIKIRGARDSNVSNNTVTIAATSTESEIAGIRLYSDDGSNYNVIIDNNTVVGTSAKSVGIIADTTPWNNYIYVRNNVLSACTTYFRLGSVLNLTKTGNTCNGVPC